MLDGLIRQWWRLGGFFGIGFVVLFIVAIVLQQAIAGEPPSYDDPIEEIRTYWTDEGNGYLAGDFLFGLAFFLLFLPFLMSLRALLGVAEGGGQVFSRTAIAAGILGLAVSGAATASWSTLAFGAEDLDDSAITTLMYLDIGAWNFLPVPFGVFLLAASIVLVMTGVIWRWLGIVGVIIGVMAIVSPLSILADDPEDSPLGFLGFISFLGLAVWILLASIGMLMRKEAPVEAGVRRAEPM